jgi:hypothetical protein
MIYLRVHDSLLTTYRLMLSFVWVTDKLVMYLARLNKLDELSDINAAFLLSSNNPIAYYRTKWY